MNITYFLFIICFSFSLFMFFYFKWYIKRRTSASVLLPEEKTEVNRLIVEINAVTDRNLTLLEDKIKELKEISNDTGKRISVYVKELEKSRAGEQLYSNLGRGIRAALRTEAEPSLQGDAQGAQNAAQSSPQLSAVRPNIEVNPQISLAPAMPPPVSAFLFPDEMPSAPVSRSGGESRRRTAAQTQKPPSKRQIRIFIDQLISEGVPPDEIASRLDISIAEVQLAMNLQRKK